MSNSSMTGHRAISSAYRRAHEAQADDVGDETFASSGTGVWG